MPILSRENLAMRLRRNWMSQACSTPLDANIQVDDSLTSLSWLQNLNIMNVSDQGCANGSQPSTSGPNTVLNPIQLPSNKGISGIDHRYQGHPPLMTNPQVIGKVDYKSNTYVKPPYSYATLICMAIKESEKNKITLSGIYSWIAENFVYYRMADPSWQNSIRHNLSLNKCFQKVARRKDEPGKGGFWKINPDHSDMFVNGVLKRRRSGGPEQAVSPCAKRKRENRPMSSDQDRDMHKDRNIIGSSDLIWSSVLQQDIEIEGVNLKTEQLIDDNEILAATDSITDHSLTDEDSFVELKEPDGTAIDLGDLGTEFLNCGLNFELDTPLDMISGDPLDLSITGTSIKPPAWWTDTGSLPAEEPSSVISISPSPVQFHDETHPWAEDHSDVVEIVCDTDIFHVV